MFNSPENIDELMQRCRQIEGLSFYQLAKKLDWNIPPHQWQRKGWAGCLIEQALGSNAGTQALPDFTHLGVELKTLPLNWKGKPSESTYVTTVPLLTINQQTWLDSNVYHKLNKVLWIPVEGDQGIAYPQRRIGRALLHSPDEVMLEQLKQDWLELTELIVLGQLDSIDASLGRYLHIRPKAAHGKTLCQAYDEAGYRIQTLPRGFYLRTLYTAKIFS